MQKGHLKAKGLFGQEGSSKFWSEHILKVKKQRKEPSRLREQPVWGVGRCVLVLRNRTLGHIWGGSSGAHAKSVYLCGESTLDKH